MSINGSQGGFDPFWLWMLAKWICRGGAMALRRSAGISRSNIAFLTASRVICPHLCGWRRVVSTAPRAAMRRMPASRSRGGDVSCEAFGEIREHILSQPGYDGFRCAFCPSVAEFLKPLFGYRLEGFLLIGFGGLRLLSFFGGVQSCSQELAFRIATFTCLSKGDVGIDPEAQPIGFVCMGVAEAPPLLPLGGYLEKQPSPGVDEVGLFLGFRVAKGRISWGHPHPPQARTT